ncbi:MAG: hypothetical protein ACKVX7_01670 [Planctomycetota bacterium]
MRAVANRKPDATIGGLDGVDALIAALANLRGRELRDSIATLEDLTGQYEHGDFLDAWSLWWQAQRENWQPTATGKGAADKTRAPAGRTAVVRSHGTPIDSQRVVFVQDISGGMGRQLDGEWKGPGPTRLDVSKRELDRVLDKLSDDAWVNLVYFGSYYYSFAKEPQPLKSERRRLKDFNAQQEIPKPQGHNRGNVYDTLAQVIQRSRRSIRCISSPKARRPRASTSTTTASSTTSSVSRGWRKCACTYC